VYSYDRNI